MQRLARPSSTRPFVFSPLRFQVWNSLFGCPDMSFAPDEEEHEQGYKASSWGEGSAVNLGPRHTVRQLSATSIP